MPQSRAELAAEDHNRFTERTGSPGRADATLSFEQEELRQALSVWREKAGSGEMPSRRDISATTLKPFLPNVAIMDVVEEGGQRRFKIRLIGTAVARLLGDHTGRFLDEAIASPQRERWSSVINAAVNARAPLRNFGRLEYRGQEYLTVELMMAPIGARPDSAEAVLIVAYARSSAPSKLELMALEAADAKAAE
jgi:hypothetical protein